jgi:delta(3,5)-delta(2,4)-dienoyl-CoA isomerase
MGTLAFLPKITGNSSLVHELSYTGRPFSASESEKLGVVSRVIEGGRLEVIKAALELAKLIANKSPVAVASAKHLICHSRDHTVAENLSYTSVWNAAALMTRVIVSDFNVHRPVF